MPNTLIVAWYQRGMSRVINHPHSPYEWQIHSIINTKPISANLSGTHDPHRLVQYFGNTLQSRHESQIEISITNNSKTPPYPPVEVKYLGKVCEATHHTSIEQCDRILPFNLVFVVVICVQYNITNVSALPTQSQIRRMTFH